VAWMLYGATGYTGKLIIEAAIARGHRPIIAGRNESKVRLLAAQYGVDYAAFPVEDALEHLLNHDVDLVLNAAGPFIHTSAPMIDACLRAGCDYLDITGEVAVFEHTFSQDTAARERGIALISGVGFDIVPSNCLATYVAGKLPNATSLEIVVYAISDDFTGSDDFGASAGTLKTMLEMLAEGGCVRRSGELLPLDFGAGERSARFLGETGAVNMRGIAIPWGDVITSYHSTHIPNITCYMVIPAPVIPVVRATGVMIQYLTKIAPLRNWLGKQFDAVVTGPSEQRRDTARAWVYAEVCDAAGNHAEAWLETCEAYRFTAESAVLSVERTRAGEVAGALSPAQAFGADFVLDIETSRRYDSLEEHQNHP